MAYAIGVVVIVVGIIVSVALHELGHLLPAKAFHARVPRYMVGFGPTLWSKTIGGTEYGIKAILLGGYVRILGMYPPARPGQKIYKDKHHHTYTQEEADALPEEQRGALEPTLAQEARQAADEEVAEGISGKPFYALSMWQKIIVMLGGPMMNAVLSVVFLVLAFGVVGYQAPTTTLEAVAPCAVMTASGQCAPHSAPGPAYAAGLRAGDRIVSWGGKRTTSFDQIRQEIARNAAHPTQVRYIRNGHEYATTVQAYQSGSSAPTVGIASHMSHRRAGVAEIASTASHLFTGTVAVIVRLPQGLWDTVSAMIHSQPRATSGVMSVVGIGRVAGEMSSAQGVSSLGDRIGGLLSLIASLNMALFVFNLIPLVPLDGGHIVGAFYEGAKRKIAQLRGLHDPGPADTARMMPITMIVWVLLIVMTLILVVADIVNPIRVM